MEALVRRRRLRPPRIHYMELKGCERWHRPPQPSMWSSESITWSWKNSLAFLAIPSSSQCAVPRNPRIHYMELKVRGRNGPRSHSALSRIHYMELKEYNRKDVFTWIEAESITWSWKPTSVASFVSNTGGIHYMELKVSIVGVLLAVAVSNPLHGVESYFISFFSLGELQLNPLHGVERNSHGCTFMSSLHMNPLHGVERLLVSRCFSN